MYLNSYLNSLLKHALSDSVVFRDEEKKKNVSCRSELAKKKKKKSDTRTVAQLCIRRAELGRGPQRAGNAA